MSDKTNRNLGSALLLFCLVGGIWGVVNQNRRIRDHAFTTGEVYDCRVGGRGNAGGAWIDYTYFINGKRYEGSSNVPTDKIRTSNIRRLMFKRSFPVAYEPSNPSNSELLIIPEDFKRFGKLFPDTLNWMKKDLLKN